MKVTNGVVPFLAFAGSARAWGNLGHETVGYVPNASRSHIVIALTHV